MKKHFPYSSLAFLLVGAFSAQSAHAEVLDRPTGIKIGDRMTLRPFVSMSLTYDSNPRSRNGDSFENGDCLWTIAPSLSLAYNAENWALLLSGYYNYRQYFKNENQEYNSHNFGEDLRWNWADSSGMEKGWSLIIGQSYKQITMADDMVLADGSNYSSDSRQFQFSGAIQRRFNEKVHADLNASYYWLDYLNDKQSTGAYYGWDRWTAGAEVGYAASKWTDIILSGAYQGFQQDNAENLRLGTDYAGQDIGDTSVGYTFQAGLGSLLTDRISYRLLAGWSRFEYGDNADAANGFVYTASGNWKIGETWNTMILASSYYQPSERQYATQSRVDAISWGLAKVMIRGKLRATLDLRYRRETHEYTIDTASDNDYILNIVTGRIGANYTFNRFFSFFAYLEYQKSMNDHSDERYGAYDYDRFRATIGAALSY